LKAKSALPELSYLAEQVGYSEREMFRLLGELYRRLGAANRSEALDKAARLGVFDD